MSEERNYAALPEQIAYKIDAETSPSFGYDSIDVKPLVFTNEIKCLLVEGDPGDKLDWHTHTPELEMINMCLEGKCRYTVKQEEGQQEIDLEQNELVYLPGGAENKLEIIGDDHHVQLCIYGHHHVGRMDVLTQEGAGSVYDQDTESWPIALWFDMMRDEVVTRDESSVTKGEFEAGEGN